MVHGGPGRAGGGEELGGLRAMHHGMQRTALQGSPAMIARLTGAWTKGAPEIVADAHPFPLPLRGSGNRPQLPTPASGW